MFSKWNSTVRRWHQVTPDLTRPTRSGRGHVRYLGTPHRPFDGFTRAMLWAGSALPLLAMILFSRWDLFPYYAIGLPPGLGAAAMIGSMGGCEFRRTVAGVYLVAALAVALAMA